MESINAPMLSRFLNSWLSDGAAVESADPSGTADEFPDLRDAASEIIDQVTEIAAESKFSDEQFKWTMDYHGGLLNVSHLTALHDWLIVSGLMVGNIQKKPAPASKKSTPFFQSTLKLDLMSNVFAATTTSDKEPPVKIMHDGKLVTMSATMLREARLEASKYPGCVENGMATAAAVFKIRVCLPLIF